MSEQRLIEAIRISQKLAQQIDDMLEIIQMSKDWAAEQGNDVVYGYEPNIDEIHEVKRDLQQLEVDVGIDPL